jgi:hypothetical protein
MAPDKLLLFVVMMSPLLAFIIAGISEYKASRGIGSKHWSLIAITMAIISFGVFIGPGLFMEISPEALSELRWVMIPVSALVACSGVFVPFSKRRNAILVVCGGLLMLLTWMVDRFLA